MLSDTDYQVPPCWRDWLADRGSLTARLLNLSGGDLSVVVANQGLAFPKRSEQRALNLSGRRKALIREVILYGGGQPWVYARSVLPLTTLTGRLRKLRHLDNRPLGALLFKDPNMRREAVQIAHFKNNNLPHLLNNLGTSAWGRRSVFRLDNKPLLVSEVFLPTFKPYNGQKTVRNTID
jgi:chorismate--pyruvate lyase